MASTGSLLRRHSRGRWSGYGEEGPRENRRGGGRREGELRGTEVARVVGGLVIRMLEMRMAGISPGIKSGRIFEGLCV